MTTGELIRRMVLAHATHDDAGFNSAVRDLIEEERRKNHTIFARELERILANGNGSRPEIAGVLASLDREFGNVPKDKDRAADLLEIVEPQRTIDDLVLRSPTAGALSRVTQENRQAELLHAHGLAPARRILFHGPSGCGKTAAAEALATALYQPLVLVRFDAVVSSYLGETAANLRRVFDFVQGRPMVLFFDEFDAIAKRRDDADEHGELKRVVNSFLQMLDRSRGDALMIAATNHEQMLDPAIWRRFDTVVPFALPSAEEIVQLLLRLWRQVQLAPGVVVSSVAEVLCGQSHADVERFAIDALKSMVLRNVSVLDAGLVDEALCRANVRHAAVARPATNSACVMTKREEPQPAAVEGGAPRKATTSSGKSRSTLPRGAGRHIQSPVRATSRKKKGR